LALMPPLIRWYPISRPTSKKGIKGALICRGPCWTSKMWSWGSRGRK
jgi:hypothetical protein